jgi:peptide/nickel transport system permease protein
VRSIPHLPLWLALAAILPVSWSPILIYFGITIILGLIDWTGLARAVRSRLLSLREEDFCVAAQLMGASPKRIIFRHLMPSFMSHLIASATLAIPGMILGETALSFLGSGHPAADRLLGRAAERGAEHQRGGAYPWLMLPMVPVIIVVLAFNFMGDGLSDAADPYK